GRNIFFNQPTDQVPLFVCDIHKCRFSYKRQIHSIYYKKHTFETCSSKSLSELEKLGCFTTRIEQRRGFKTKVFEVTYNLFILLNDIERKARNTKLR
ncbi:hypothetical protein, partial [Hydrotalea sp. AMD]|uniref:hypothetical protein n=1 Tax=Hydrotalea sp. AMD TaxID=2501297 RepID=UPI00257CBDFE